MLGGGQIWNQSWIVIIYILSFTVMNALNSCSWCGRVDGEVKIMKRRVAVFGAMMDWHLRWSLVGEKGVSTSGGTNLVVVDKVWCKGTGGEKDQRDRERLRRRETVEGLGKRVLEGNKGRENHYGWDFIFSGEEEGQLVVERKSICFHDRGCSIDQVRFLGGCKLFFRSWKIYYA